MRKAITQEIFEQRIKERFPDEQFKVIFYTSIGEAALIQCLQCQQIIEVTKAHNFLEKQKVHGCKNCYGLWRQREEKLQQLQENYEILSTHVVDTHTYYVCKCKLCGRQRDTSLANYLHSKCYCQGGYRQWTAQEWINWLKEERNDEYELLTSFTRVTDKVLLKHKTCGFIWSVRPSDVNSGASCPRCGRNESKGCRIITKTLESLNINFEKEYPLANTKLRLDFHFFFNNQEYGIEYNGEQHYNYTPYFHRTGPEGLQIQKDRDRRKQLYCDTHNINLIIIPYTMQPFEIKQLINNLFGSTTSQYDVASSEAKQHPSAYTDEDMV